MHLKGATYIVILFKIVKAHFCVIILEKKPSTLSTVTDITASKYKGNTVPFSTNETRYQMLCLRNECDPESHRTVFISLREK